MAPGRGAKRVLIIDDDQDALDLMRSLCLDAGVEIDAAMDGASAVQRALEHPPDLVILDMVLPDTGGIDILHRLRAEPRLTAVPVMVVSARRDQASKIAAFEAGADDYVHKPYDLREVLARLRSQLSRRELLEKLERTNIELRLANERLEELAITDELTGLANARHFRNRLEEEFLRAERYETSLALVVVDLDGFKAVNDDFGHHAGDRLLSQVAGRLVAQARSTDIVCRVGGDEFAFLLPHTELDAAEHLAHRLCEKIGSAPLRLVGGKLAAVGLSCGVAAWPECAAIGSSSDLFIAADQALYRAKRAGKGVVVCAPSAAGETPRAENEESARKRPGFPTSPREAEAR
ncbi:MAG: diguanylate cyclase [Acidobacteriota bacterium]|nr:diguanylate cyclase [Acidobacteriota bacterium]MDQ7087918.1 diguanylate cyclase [Acidobacteriota bacterium]